MKFFFISNFYNSCLHPQAFRKLFTIREDSTQEKTEMLTFVSCLCKKQKPDVLFKTKSLWKKARVCKLLRDMKFEIEKKSK